MATVLYYGLLIAIGGWFAALFWQWRNLPGLAGEIYDSNVEKGLLSDKISRDDYIDCYTKSERPRLGLYRCVTALICLLTLPLLVGFFSNLIDAWTYQRSIWYGPADLLQIMFDFCIFLVVMLIYGVGLYFVTRHYYKTAPPTLKTQIKQLEQNAGV